ncbi:MAG: tRNA dihydrouridine synthase [Candidatus Promineifilaceae bacterium]
MLEPTFFVRDIPIYGDVILAPMAGYADVPHRALCRSFGSAMQYTEFVAAEELLGGGKSAWRLLDFKKGEESPMVFQIFSNSAERLLNAALRIAELEPDIIDINMGCSTRKVSGRGAGVGMMKKPLEVAKTFELLSKQLPMPITGKIRLGWQGAENYHEIAHIMQESGASLVAIHPRTKEQKYSGHSNWDAIAELKQALSIPVIGNGDISTPDDIDAMLDYTGCDAVMVGRGAIGNPWLLGRKRRDELTLAELIGLVRLHANEMVAYYGERGLVLFRKFLKRYLTGVVSAERIKKLLTTTILADFHQQLNALLPPEQTQLTAPHLAVR